MIFVVLAENEMSAENIERRKALAPAHQNFLRQHAARIPLAGPLRDQSPDSVSIGGMWMVKAENKTEVEALLRADPFFPTRKDCKILYWAHGYPEMRAL